jgi:hypothetical protein
MRVLLIIRGWEVERGDFDPIARKGSGKNPIDHADKIIRNAKSVAREFVFRSATL